jgi:peptidyl-prolyl cis-trans isomerase SurA
VFGRVPDTDIMADFEIMISRLQTIHRSWLLALALGVLAFTALPSGATAQSIVVMVNDEPITSYDVAQRQRFLAMTSGLGEKMKARLKAPETQSAWQEFVQKHRPQSKEEAQALQKQFVGQLQQQVISSASNSMRQEAIEQLIDERLMLQAAKDNKITVTDAQVDEAMTRMAQGNGRNTTLQEFQESFKQQGVNPVTLKDRIRAQTAWRQVIRRIYGSRVQSAVSPAAADAKEAGRTLVDVELIKLTMPGNADQKAVAKRLVEAEAIRKGFSKCSEVAGQVKGHLGVTVQSMKAVNVDEFRGDVRAAISKAKAGEITPPIVSGGAIELHAICNKKVEGNPAEKKEEKAEAQDKVQEEFQLYSRRHLKDMKDRANLRYPKSG